MSERPKYENTVSVGEVVLAIPEGVWPPYKTGQLIANEIMPAYGSHIESGVVVDDGTGSGLFAIKAGQMGAREVYALDLNEKAISTTTYNWGLNGLNGRLRALVSDGLSAMPESARGGVNFLVANPPVQPMVITGDNGDFTTRPDAYAWNEARDNGRAVLDDILLNGPMLIRSGGVIVTSTTTRHGFDTTRRILDQQGEGGAISDWRVIHRETHQLAPFYDQYVPTWVALQEQDGDTRIWKGENEAWNHDFIVLEITK